MHVLLVEPDYYTQYPPLGLLKLSAYHKAKGDTVQFVRGTAGWNSLTREPAKVYVTSLFTWAWRPVHSAVNHAKAVFPKSDIWLGGVYASLMPEHARLTGVNVKTGIFPEMEDILPDYDIVPRWNKERKASIFFTHRGCVRRCSFCAVPALEGKPSFLRKKLSIRHLVHPSHDRAILWDNNILGEDHWSDVVAELSSMKVSVDFNQGLDARFINDNVAARLKTLRMPTIRVAYDFPKLGDAVRRGIDCLANVGFRRRQIISYVLFNYKDTPEDLFIRVRDLLEWGACAYPMRYQPLNSLEKDSHIASTWTKEELEMVANARRVIGSGGAFPPYEGLRKKFTRAKNFHDAFGLWSAKNGSRTSSAFHIPFVEMGADHEYPVNGHISSARKRWVKTALHL